MAHCMCKACFTKLKKAATYLAMAENIANELREKFAIRIPFTIGL